MHLRNQILSACCVLRVLATALRCIYEEPYTFKIFLLIYYLVNIKQIAMGFKKFCQMTAIQKQRMAVRCAELCLLVRAVVILNEQ